MRARSHADFSDLTLLLTTYRRPGDLARGLGFFQQHYELPALNLVVLDGSPAPENAENAAICNRFGVRYQAFDPDLSLYERWRDGMAFAHTPYVCFVPDDDFLDPDGLAQSLAFLRQNPDYASAHGHDIRLKIEPDGSFRMAQYLYPWFRSTEQDNPLERLIWFFYHYSDLTYAVHRTALLKPIMETLPQYVQPDYFVFLEFILNALTVLKGKVKVVDAFYLGRQYGQLTYQPIPWERAVYMHDFLDQVQRFKACVVAHAAFTGLSEAKREALVDYAFMAFLTRMYLFPKRCLAQGMRLANDEIPGDLYPPSLLSPKNEAPRVVPPKSLPAILMDVAIDVWETLRERLLYHRYTLPTRYQQFQGLEAFLLRHHPKYRRLARYLTPCSSSREHPHDRSYRHHPAHSHVSAS